MITEKIPRNVRKVRLHEVCKPLQYNASSARTIVPLPQVVHFNFSGDVLGMIKGLCENELYARKLFSVLWYRHTENLFRENKERKLSLDDVADKVWRPSKDRFNEIIGKLKNGMLTLKEVDVLFCDFKGENYFAT